MNAYLKFIDCTTLFFASIQYYQDAPDPLGSGDKTKKNICVSKSSVALQQFVLNAKDHFGQTDFNFDIVFTGNSIGNDINGNPRILWTPKLDFAKNKNSNKFYSSGYGIFINNITGSIITTLMELNPMQIQQDCNGNKAFSEVAMNTSQNDNNFIQLSAEVDVLGGIGKTIEFKNISLTADSRAYIETYSELKVHRDNCGISASIGGVQEFYAFIYNVPLGLNVHYSWTVNGGVQIGANGNYWFKVQLDNTGTNINVQVQINLVDLISQTIILTETKSVGYSPETTQTVKWKTLACKMKSYTVYNWFVNPLWDPLRDFIVKPIGKKDIARMEKFAKTFSNDIKTLKGLLSNQGR